jgi:S-adenosylmethionine:tRNA ribosyltransferase-isomerase
MDLARFDFTLPPALIAQHPAPRRDASRLLVISRSGPLRHLHFPDLVNLLQPEDLLVRNDTRVLPARLIGRRDTGGRVELLLLEPVGAARWRALARPTKSLRPGKRLIFDFPVGAGLVSAPGGQTPAPFVYGNVIEKHDDGAVVVEFAIDAEKFDALLATIGRMPLPPYIHRRDDETPEVLAEDRDRYQTIYAREPGAVAAPTAGLHFTDEVLARIRAKGVAIADLTLHVGAGTFLPVRVANLDDHVMHHERFALPPETADAIAACRRRGGRVAAVGTTTARVLETQANDDGAVRPGAGSTNLFIKPGHAWRAVDVLLTNFHLPKSTLLVLVCALAGTDRLLAAYREAVAREYRFFSYGDACWIERNEE